jgi:hypothetical protein
MQYLFVIVAFVAIFVNFIMANPSGSAQNATASAKIEKSVKGASTGVGTTEIQGSTPGFLLNTFITSGPEEGEVIYKTNKVVFKFSGITTLAPQNEISYETKVIGLDSGWQSNSSGERVVGFPVSNKEYTFLVRAKVNGYYDSTPAQRTFRIKVSDNYGKIKISSISLKSIILSVNLGKGENLNISGWKIVGRRGEFVIPQAVKTYPWTSAAAEDTLVVNGESIYIQNAANPFATNLVFKPNKCFAYLYLNSSGTSFPSSYTKICPQINEENVCNFSASCRKLILRLNSCSQPAFSITDDPSCWEYIKDYVAKNLNYNGCVNNYIRDSDFWGSTWYVYTNFLPTCECGDSTIYLYDQNGFLVDKYERYNSGCCPN